MEGGLEGRGCGGDAGRKGRRWRSAGEGWPGEEGRAKGAGKEGRRRAAPEGVPAKDPKGPGAGGGRGLEGRRPAAEGGRRPGAKGLRRPGGRGPAGRREWEAGVGGPKGVGGRRPGVGGRRPGGRPGVGGRRVEGGRRRRVLERAGGRRHRGLERPEAGEGSGTANGGGRRRTGLPEGANAEGWHRRLAPNGQHLKEAPPEEDVAQREGCPNRAPPEGNAPGSRTEPEESALDGARRCGLLTPPRPACQRR